MKYTLDKYKKECNDFFEEIQEELLVDCGKKEAYLVKNSYRSDVPLKFVDENSYMSLYRKTANIKELLDRVYDNLTGILDDEEDDDIGDIMYWRLTKYRIFNEEYEEIFSLILDCNGNIISASFDAYSLYILNNQDYEQDPSLIYFTKKCFELNVAEVKYPFKPGDIVKFDNMPTQLPTTGVFCGNRKIENDNGYNAWFLYEENDGRLCTYRTIGIFNKTEIKLCEHISDSEKVNNVSELLKLDSSYAYKIYAGLKKEKPFYEES